MRPKGQLFDMKSFRLERKITQQEVAEAVNVNKSFINAIEHGKRSAPPGVLNELARIYQVEDISQYLYDPAPAMEIKNVRSSNINSPGGVVVPSETLNKVPKEDLDRILIKDVSNSDSNGTDATSSMADRLFQLLKLAEDRYERERQKADELTKRVIELEKENARLRVNQ
ncbi:MAG: helix-turn-helix transcriptional regulator [Bacteroidales bacterium]|nr:helix-turn-helix transcriptional regulator [Bacteroidales bacterium]